MFLFLFDILFGILCFFLLKSLRLLLFLLFMNRILPHLTPTKILPIVLILLIILLYFPSIMIILLTILITTLIYNSSKNRFLTESQPKKLILYFPMVLLIFLLYFLHNLLFSQMKIQYFMAFLLFFDAFSCAFGEFARLFLSANFEENFGVLLSDLPEIDNIQEIHKRNLMKFVSHCDNFADILQENSINSLPVLTKRFYHEKLGKFDLRYVHYGEKAIFIVFLLFSTAFCEEKHCFERILIEIIGVLHIDWLSLSLNSSGETSLKKAAFKKVFLMVLYKFFLAFSLGFTNFSLGYFVFFSIETLLFLENSQQTKKFAVHLACGFIFLVINQRITQENTINSGIFITNLCLLLIKYIKDKKNSKIFEENMNFSIILARKNLEVFSRFFMQEIVIFLSIFAGFFFTHDIFMAFQWTFIVISWVLMRFLYENLKLNDFHLFGNLSQITRKYEESSKIYQEFSKNFVDENSAEKVAGFFFHMKKQEKNLFFHNFHKIENLKEWASARFFRNSKLLITDERIILAGIGMIGSSVVLIAIARVFFGVGLKEEACFVVGIVIFLGFFVFLACFFEKILAKTIWEVFFIFFFFLDFFIFLFSLDLLLWDFDDVRDFPLFLQSFRGEPLLFHGKRSVHLAPHCCCCRGFHPKEKSLGSYKQPLHALLKFRDNLHSLSKRYVSGLS